MREIKFRGLSVNGDWYYGYLSESQCYNGQPEKGFYISNSCGMPWAYQVRPETVGQYTGLKDKNGVEIYKGDICIQHDYPFYSDGLCNYRGVIEWFSVDACWYLELYVVSDRVRGAACGGMLSEYPQIEVIGNIYKNPELI